MNRLGEWLRRVWYLLNRRRLDAALREEMAAHRAQMNRPGRFGNSLRLREEAHDVWGWRWLDDLGRDLRLGVRTLRRSPGFTLASLAILSVGIGINLAFFQVVDVALLQPLHVTAPQTLVLFHYRSPTFMSTGVPYPVARFVGARTDALSAVLVSRGAMGAWGDLGDEIVPGEFVSTNWFDELGASAAAGRVLHAGTDDGPAAPAVVVLSYRFWQRSFGGQFGIIGRTVRLNGQPAVVVGVADAQFRVLARDDPRFWIPIEQIDAFQPGSHIRTDWVTKNVTMYGRLRPGVSAAVAKTVLAAALDQLSAIRPDAIERGQWLEPYSAVDRFMPPQERRQAWTVVTGVAVLTAIVLMVTCLNLSNLTLVRAISRLREMSIRTALGAGRWRIVRHLGIESVLLATAGTLGCWVLGVGTTAVVASATEVSLPVGFRLRLANGLGRVMRRARGHSRDRIRSRVEDWPSRSGARRARWRRARVPGSPRPTFEAMDRRWSNCGELRAPHLCGSDAARSGARARQRPCVRRGSSGGAGAVARVVQFGDGPHILLGRRSRDHRHAAGHGSDDARHRDAPRRQHFDDPIPERAPGEVPGHRRRSAVFLHDGHPYRSGPQPLCAATRSAPRSSSAAVEPSRCSALQTSSDDVLCLPQRRRSKRQVGVAHR